MEEWLLFTQFLPADEPNLLSIDEEKTKMNGLGQKHSRS
jgi:hypothetical protein